MFECAVGVNVRYSVRVCIHIYIEIEYLFEYSLIRWAAVVLYGKITGQKYLTRMSEFNFHKWFSHTKGLLNECVVGGVNVRETQRCDEKMFKYFIKLTQKPCSLTAENHTHFCL